MHHAATAITAPDTDQLPAYWQFHDAVAQAQLLAWLPRGRHMIVDVSGPRSPGGELAAMAGHRVLRVIDAGPGTAASQRTAGAAWTDERGTSEEGRRRLKRRPEVSGRIERAGQQSEREDRAPLALRRDRRQAPGQRCEVTGRARGPAAVLCNATV